MKPKYTIQHVLELSCSAFRMNGGLFGLHQRGAERISQMVKQTLGVKEYPETLTCEVIDEDIEFAKNLTTFFQRLTLDVLADRYIHDKKYEREIYHLFQSGEVSSNKITHVAKLPGFSFIYLSALEIQKEIPFLKSGALGEEGTYIANLECKIITQSKCVNYPGFNIHGNINGLIVTWYSNLLIPQDNIIIENARIKENGTEWFTGLMSSRLCGVYRK